MGAEFFQELVCPPVWREERDGAWFFKTPISFLRRQMLELTTLFFTGENKLERVSRGKAEDDGGRQRQEESLGKRSFRCPRPQDGDDKMDYVG